MTIPSPSGAGLKRICSHFFISLLTLFLLSCAIVQTRPVQEMSDTAASIRAAREVQADTLSPELFRQANEFFFKAKNEYKIKNFLAAKQFAQKARYYAEKAEFESIRGGGTRSEQSAPENKNGGSAPIKLKEGSQQPYPYPSPTGTPAESLINPPTHQ